MTKRLRNKNTKRNFSMYNSFYNVRKRNLKRILELIADSSNAQKF